MSRFLYVVAFLACLSAGQCNEGPTMSAVWNMLGCIPWPWSANGFNPAEDTFLKTLTTPNIREWAVDGEGWSLQELKQASEQSAMTCRRPRGQGTGSELQHANQFEIDVTSPERKRFLDQLANLAYSATCFGGPYQNRPGFHRACKDTVARLYGRTPQRMTREALNRFQSNICQLRRRMNDPTQPPPAAISSSKEGRDWWRRYRGQVSCAETQLGQWLENRWIPEQGDEQARNARWYHNRRVERMDARVEKAQKVHPLMWAQSKMDEVKESAVEAARQVQSLKPAHVVAFAASIPPPRIPAGPLMRPRGRMVVL